MNSIVYRDLAGYGLPFLKPGDPGYSALVEEICLRDSVPDEALDDAAVMINRSGKSIVATTVLWKYHDAFGGSRVNFDSSFASTGVFEATAENNIVVNGSKRLITWQRTFGDNSDIVPRPPRPASSGHGWVFRSVPRSRELEGITSIEVQLDFVVFDDGLCVGPDERRSFDGIIHAIAAERQLVDEVIAKLRAGGTAVDVFATLNPLTRRHAPPPPQASGAALGPLLVHAFANRAMQQVIRQDETQLLAWFENVAMRQKLDLRRPV